MLRILLVDDHAIVREGFKRLLDGSDDFTVVAEAADVEQALAAARRSVADIAVIDVSLGKGRSGLALLPQLRAVTPGLRCVMLSMHDDPGLVIRALESGARGYVTKDAATEELLALLRKVARGEIVLSRDLSMPSASAMQGPRLTARERDTLRGLLSERPPKAIAADLGISDKTLYRHRANLMEKLGARTLGELARIARERGLLLES